MLLNSAEVRDEIGAGVVDPVMERTSERTIEKAGVEVD